MGQRCSLVAGLVFLSAQVSAQVCPVQTARLVAPDGQPGDWMGSSVSALGDFVVIGAQKRDGGAFDAGGGYVFARTVDGLTYNSTLSAAGAHPSDWLGMTCAAGGDFMIIGSRNAVIDDIGSGGCYVFSLQPGGGWQQSAILAPPLLVDGDLFGAASISADTAVVGAWGNDNFITSGGSAFVFFRDPAGNWQFAAELGAADPGTSDFFGYAVDISGDTIIVGADGDDDRGTSSGSAYIFHRDETGAWSQEAKLLAGDGLPVDLFGFAVAIDGDTAVVGAPDADAQGNWSGAAYVFRRTAPGTWVQEAKLLAASGGPSYFQGGMVDVQGSLAIISAWGFDDYRGAVFVFERSAGGVWSEVAMLTASDGRQGDTFGSGISMDSGRVVVGAPFASNENGSEAGTVYVFDLFCSTGCTGDLNADGTVNLTDLATQLVHYGETSAPPQDGDLNADGTIDLTDLAALLAVYGTICP